MSWSKLGVLMLFICIIFTVAIFGAHFGYTVNGVPKGGDIEGKPGILGAIEWGWNAIGFLWDMMTFQVDDCPDIMGYIFAAISLICLFIIVSIFLPGGSG